MLFVVGIGGGGRRGHAPRPVPLEVVAAPGDAGVVAVGGVDLPVAQVAVAGHPVAIGIGVGIVAKRIQPVHDFEAVVHRVAVGVPVDRIGAEDELLDIGKTVVVGIVVGGALNQRIEGVGDRGAGDDDPLDHAGGIVRLAGDQAVGHDRVHPEVVFPAIVAAVAIGIGKGRIGAGPAGGHQRSAGFIRLTGGIGVGGIQAGMEAADLEDMAEGCAIGQVPESQRGIDEVGPGAARQEVGIGIFHAVRALEIAGRGIPHPFPTVGEFVLVDVGVIVLDIEFAAEDAADDGVAVGDGDGRDGGRQGGGCRDQVQKAVADPDMEETVVDVGHVPRAHHDEVGREGIQRGRGQQRMIAEHPTEKRAFGNAGRRGQPVVDPSASQPREPLIRQRRAVRVFVDRQPHGRKDLHRSAGRIGAAILVTHRDGDVFLSGFLVRVARGAGSASDPRRLVVAEVDPDLQVILVHDHIGGGPRDRVGRTFGAIQRQPGGNLGRIDQDWGSIRQRHGTGGGHDKAKVADPVNGGGRG